MDKYYKYMVATLCKTYNHAPYIEEALNGFAMQQTTFPCVYIVIDDASTDGEPDVLRQWAEKNLALDTEKGGVYEQKTFGDRYVAYLKNNANSLFVIILLSENHHCKKPKKPYFSEWIDNAKYRALCEGDDYWTNPQKLQLQVNYLESNPEYGLVHTKCKGFNENKKEYEKSLIGKRVDTFETFLEGNTIVTASTLFSTRIDDAYSKDLPKQRTWPSIDLSRWLYFYLHSKVGFLEETTAAYRILDESASHSKVFENMIRFYNSSAEICRYYIEQSGQEKLLKKINKKYLRLITHHYYVSGKKVEWNAISRYLCFDLKSFMYIVASYILPGYGKKA